jgi:hypothetical protein
MGEQINNPMYGEEFKTFKEEWSKAAGILRPIVERQKELKPININLVKPIRYGHAIRYEWREQTIWL